MNKLSTLPLVFMLAFGVANTLAQSPQNVQTPPNARLRGEIAGFDGHVLRVKTREGKVLELGVPDDAKISVLSPLKLSAIKRGSFVGVTAILAGPGSTLQALEVHVFPESMRGTGEGHYDWDLEPGSTMTNANVDAVVTANNGKELTLGYKGGSQKIFVPRGVPVVTFHPADRSRLKAPAPVFVIAQRARDGSLTALRILVGSRGLKPPM